MSSDKNSQDKQKKVNKDNKLKKWAEKLFPILLVIILLSLFYIPLFRSIQQQNFLTFPDSERQITFSTQFYRYIFNHSENPNFPRNEYPPAAHIITAFFYRIFGRSLFVAKISMLFFAAILLLSLYGIGNHYGGRASAITLTAMGAGSPWVMVYHLEYYPDLPAASFVALFFYLLLRSNYFENKKFSLLAGASVGLAFLCKWTALAVVILPLLWFIAPAVIKSWKTGLSFLISMVLIVVFAMITFKIIFTDFGPIGDKALLLKYIGYYLLPMGAFLGLSCFKEKEYLSIFNPRHRKAALSILNFTRSIFIAFLTVAPWIIESNASIAYKFELDSNTPPALVGSTNYDIILKLLKVVFSSFSFYFYFAMAGIVLMFTYRRKLYEKIIVPVNLFFSLLLIFVILKIAEPIGRYCVIWLPFTLILGGYWVSHVKKEKLRNVIVVFVLIFCVFNMYGSWLFPGKGYTFLKKVGYCRKPVTYGQKVSDLLTFMYKPLAAGEPSAQASANLDPIADYILENAPKNSNIAFFNMTDPSGKRKYTLLKGVHLENEIFFKGGNPRVFQVPQLTRKILHGKRVVVLIYKNEERDKEFIKYLTTRLYNYYQTLPTNDKLFDLPRDMIIRVLIF